MTKKTFQFLTIVLLLAWSITAAQDSQFTANQLYQNTQRLQFEIKANPDRINSEGDWQKIINSYKLIIDSYPNDPLVDDIIFITGGVYKEMYQIFGKRSFLDNAIAQYRTILRDYPDSYLQQAALFAVAEIQENYQKSPSIALLTYKNLVERFPRGYKTSAAKNRITAIENDLGQEEKSPALTLAENKTPATPAEKKVTTPETEITSANLPEENDENKESDSYVASKKTGMAIIEDIRSSFGADNGRVTIELDREISYNYKQLTAPNRRIFFDLFNVNLSKSKLQTKEIPIENSYLKKIRLGQNQKNITRVVLDFDKFRDYKIFTLPGPGDHFRIVFDLYQAGEGPKYVSANGNTPDTSSKTADAKAENVAEKVSNGATSNSNGKYSLSRQLGAKINRIVIDPGHGGRDPGTIGFSGMTESKLNLDVAQRLKNIFNKELPEIEVILTRSSDVYLTLDQRPAISRVKEGDLFISIHSNAFRRKKASGIETYYMNYASDKEAEELAAKENAINSMSQAKLSGLLKKIMTNNKKEESKELAMFIQNHLYRQTKPVNGAARNRGVKSAPLVVLIGTSVPSVLVEVGFTNHPVEGKLLLTASYRERIATGLFKGIEAYIQSLQ